MIVAMPQRTPSATKAHRATIFGSVACRADASRHAMGFLETVLAGRVVWVEPWRLRRRLWSGTPPLVPTLRTVMELAAISATDRPPETRHQARTGLPNQSRLIDESASSSSPCGRG